MTLSYTPCLFLINLGSYLSGILLTFPADFGGTGLDLTNPTQLCCIPPLDHANRIGITTYLAVLGLLITHDFLGPLHHFLLHIKRMHILLTDHIADLQSLTPLVLKV